MTIKPPRRARPDQLLPVQPAARQLGTAGETSVKLFFEQLGWGPIPTNDHDCGTDLFVQMRDGKLVELGMMIGVQVKTGDSFFSKKKRARVGNRWGWWFTEGKKHHRTYWVNHHVPHIIVLQTEDRSTRAWAFLNEESIEVTGKGIRVFVAADQPLDRSQVQRWVDAANVARKQVAYEGSRWSASLSDLPESEWARYALLTPRLVAPHPNKGYQTPITWPEAVAFCIEATPTRWSHFAARHETVPSPREARHSDEWGWRFAAGIHEWLCVGEIDQLEQLSCAATRESYDIAKTIALAIGYVDRSRWDRATAILGEAASDSNTVDQAWLNLHRARTHIEIGQVQQGRDLLLRANTQLASVRGEVTASAIHSGVLWTLFEITDFPSRDMPDVVSSLDNIVSWWRAQAAVTGLEAAAKRYFKAWSLDRSTTFGATDVAHDQLFSSALVARLCGAHGQWRAEAALLAMVDLSTNRPTAARPLESLDLLRRAGDSKNLALAIRRVRQDGPLTDVADLVAKVDPRTMTHTGSLADLVTLAEAGHYCDDEQAEAAISFCLDTLEDTTLFVKRLLPHYTVAREVLNATAGLALHALPAHVTRIVRYLLALPDSPNQLLSDPLQKVFAELPEEDLRVYRKEFADRASAIPERGWYYWLLITLAGPDDPVARRHIRDGLLRGDLASLYAARSTTVLQPDEAEAILAACGKGLDDYHRQGVAGSLTMHRDDFALLYARVAMEFPELNAWRRLLEFLADDATYAQRKTSVCKVLSENLASVPSDVRDSLLGAMPRLHEQAASGGSRFRGSLPPVGGAFSELHLELIGADTLEGKGLLVALLGGDQESRLDVVDYFSRHSGHESTLLAMVRDDHLLVSRRAMFGLARLVSERPDVDPIYCSALRSFITEDGEAGAAHVVGGVAAATPCPPHLAPLSAELAGHPSKAIRQRAAHLRFE